MKIHHLSIRGRAIIVNSKILSKFWYVAAVLPFKKSQIREVDLFCREFVWDGLHRDAVKKEVICNPVPEGGLGLMDVGKQAQALLTKSICLTLFETTPTASTFGVRFFLGRALRALNQDWNVVLRMTQSRPIRSILPYYAITFQPTQDRIPKFFQKILNTIALIKKHF